MLNFFEKFRTAASFSRPARLKTAELTNSGDNLLVISDLHLGEDLSEFGSPELSNLVAGLNGALSEMLLYFSNNRWNDIPWQLVLAGDTFDFLKDSLRHDAPEADPCWLDKNAAAAHRLNTTETPEEISAKVHQIGQAHAPIMEALVTFLLAGNSLVIINGNHDLEFYFTIVQEAFTELLLTTWERLAKLAGHELPNPGQQDLFRQKISFRPWFYARPDLCHIEHGHLSDKWCSVTQPLLPLSRLNPPLTAIPFIQRAMPYVADLLPDFSSHKIETLSIPQLLSTLTWKTRIGLGRAMAAAIRDLTGSDPAQEELVIKEGSLLLSTYDTRGAYDTATLQKLQDIIIPPMRLSLPRLLYEIAKANNDRLDLRHYAAKIAVITGAKVVLLGHSHLPEQVMLKTSRGRKFTYINTGSWVSREVKEGADGQGQTFAIVTPYSKKPAQLYQWLGQGQLWDGRPYRPYNPFVELDY